jgi:CubicO group peptidase (beta-lactamase class C family)
VSENPGADREKLARAVDTLFTREGIGETRAVVVMHAGEIAAERYGAGYGPDTRFIGWSMSKTVVGVLMGMLVADGRLRLDASPPIPALAARRRPARRDHAAPADADALGPPAPGEGRPDLQLARSADDVPRRPRRHGRLGRSAAAGAGAGRHFQYSTPTGVILADIAERVIAPNGNAARRQRAMAEFLRARLAAPLGMRSLTAEYDRAGTMMGGSMLWANARDWAKFGDFLRHKGSARGSQIVPRGWIEFMTTPSPQAPDYGGMTWLNRSSGAERVVLFPDQGPADAFAAVGHSGQYVIVVPSRQLVVVRLGNTADDLRKPLVSALADIVALYPAT